MTLGNSCFHGRWWWWSLGGLGNVMEEQNIRRDVQNVAASTTKAEDAGENVRTRQEGSKTKTHPIGAKIEAPK